MKFYFKTYIKIWEKKLEKCITISSFPSFHYTTREFITFPQRSGPNTHQITGLRRKEERNQARMSNFQDMGRALSSESQACGPNRV